MRLILSLSLYDKEMLILCVPLQRSDENVSKRSMLLCVCVFFFMEIAIDANIMLGLLA